MKYSLLSAALVAESVMAFPFVARMPGVDSSLLNGSKDHLRKRQQSTTGAGSLANCPVNPTHVPAVGLVAPYYYNNASSGLPGNGKGGYQVPAPGDTAHYFQAPDYSKDVRGPCPGLNAAANHGFLARDGITTFNELVDAQQNLYNVGYDLAVTLALLGLTTTDGDIVNEKLSIGCDATPRTSYAPALTGSEPGLDGHNKFEADTSLTRDDYFLSSDNDNFSFNGTLFGMMTETTGGLYNRDNLALYRAQRYNQSLADNSNFYFGPFSLLLFGASSFLYELMPSGPNYIPDKATISSFFGAQENADGTYSFNGQEKIPDNWYNRVSPYTLNDVGNEIVLQYLEHPVLFGGSTGNGGFDLLNFGSIQNGVIASPSVDVVACLIYQIATERVPSSINSVVTPVVDVATSVLSILNPQFANFGCPAALSK